jgi:hypothetical protein
LGELVFWKSIWKIWFDWTKWLAKYFPEDASGQREHDRHLLVISQRPGEKDFNPRESPFDKQILEAKIRLPAGRGRLPCVSWPPSLVPIRSV